MSLASFLFLMHKLYSFLFLNRYCKNLTTVTFVYLGHCRIVRDIGVVERKNFFYFPWFHLCWVLFSLIWLMIMWRIQSLMFRWFGFCSKILSLNRNSVNGLIALRIRIRIILLFNFFAFFLDGEVILVFFNSNLLWLGV